MATKIDYNMSSPRKLVCSSSKRLQLGNRALYYSAGGRGGGHKSLAHQFGGTIKFVVVSWGGHTKILRELYKTLTPPNHK